MKKIFLLAGLLSLVVLFGLPENASAGITATENFDSYASSTTLEGANGGSNWTSAWASTGGALWNSDVAPVGGQGGFALHSTTTLGNNPSISRSFNPISKGTLHYKFKFDDTLPGDANGDHVVSFVLQDSLNTGGAANNHRIAVSLNFTGGGQISAGNGQTYVTQIGTFSTSTWNSIDIKFDNSIGNVFQVSLNSGAYSSDFSSGGSLTNIDTFWVINQERSENNLWIDDINIVDTSTVTPPTPSSIYGSGTVNRLAKFTTGTTTIGDALFSDDGTDTTLTSGNLLIPTGNIGVGTSTPSTKLYVNGDLFANWIKVAANSFGLDTLTSGTLYIGSTTASSIKIGRPSIITTIFGTTTITNLTANTANISSSVSTGVLTSSSANILGALSAGVTTLGSLSASSVTTSGSVTASSGTFTNSNTGTTTVSSLKTTSNCNSSASPAVCGSAPSGSVAMATGGSTLVVNTTAVTANSQIMITEDSSLGARLGITCNTTTTRNYRINARIASTSFTIKSSANPATNKACLSYWIIN